ncbi:MAG: pseudouridine synthase [Vicingaceae bacterium]|nr:pseudouridine synthase [Vicingaceae bacterium]
MENKRRKPNKDSKPSRGARGSSKARPATKARRSSSNNKPSKEENSNSESRPSRDGKPYRKAGTYTKAPLRKADPNRKSNNNPHTKANDGKIRLNKFLAQAGIASRREADTLIAAGVVKVNGVVVTEMGFKVSPEDKVNYGGESIRGEKKVYLLMNKPKDFITTVDDPFGRRTVLQLLGKLKERVYPVGRLDRATTGVLMLTNDGDLTKKLTHPKFGVKKIYNVHLDKNVTSNHLQHLLDGFELEDGFTKADVATYVGTGEKKNQVGIELHSGKNRIIRRMFEHLGYNVVKLDRVYFAGLTKKDMARGQWRFLTEKEVGQLQMKQG